MSKIKKAVKKKPTSPFASRILDVVNYMKHKGLAEHNGDAVAKIGADPSNASKLLSGQYSITVDQLRELCEVSGASADYILGFTSMMMRKPPKKTIDLLRLTLAAAESEQI